MAEPNVTTTYAADDGARPSADVALDVVAIVTLLALSVGLGRLSAGPLAWDGAQAAAGLVGQLGETAPAAVLVLLASAANLAAGAVLARLAAGAPIAGIGRALMAATVGAVLLDAALLFLLGGLGLFRAPLLIAIHVAILAFGWRTRPIVLVGVFQPPGSGLLWAIVGLAWLGALVVQLASPVVPFLDVLPNHVAPVERLRTFGEFATLTETASPIYGPSRTFLGYVALLGTIATMTGLPAGLAVSAFILPSSLLVAVGVHRLATAIAGPGAGLWGLLAFTLTASFGRLTDARATVVVLPLALGSLAWVADRLAEPAESTRGRDDRGPSIRDSLLLGAGLGAAVLVHPVVGALAVATVGLVALIRSGFATVGVPAIAVAGSLALPQAATMIGLDLPSVVGLAAVLPALVAARLLSSGSVAFGVVMIGRAALLAAVPLGLVWADLLVQGAVKGVADLAATMPLLVIGTVAGIVLAPRVAGHPIVLAGLAAGIIAGAATQIVPEGGGLLTDSIRFELPKTLHYWLPVLASLATAIGLFELWRRDRIQLPLRAGLVGVFLVVAAMPLRSAEVNDHHLGEHRLAETLAVDLRFAGRGYWVGYPDVRHVVDGPRAELLEAIRGEIAGGRIRGETNLLHVAPTFQQWVATPFGVFTGIRETVVAPDAGETIHTVGGRLRPVDELGALLDGGSFAYIVLEPGDGIPPDARDRIVGAGYDPIFANGQGEVFATT